MTPTVCLYCPTESDRPFGRAEHVIPQAFGKFESREGNLTLHNVCTECNAYFGHKLEQHFGRDSGDAFLRLLTGLKAAGEAHELGGRRLTFRIDEPGKEFDGAWVTMGYSEEAGNVIEVLPQVRFRSRFETKWRWYRAPDLMRERLDEFRHSEFTIFGSDDEMAQLMARLEEIGVNVLETRMVEGSGEPHDGSPVVIEVRYAIDEVVLRTIAKVAFNYLARMTEERVPGFVRRGEFEPIRRFIRHGVPPGWDAVGISRKKILLGDTRRHRMTNGHLIVASWPDPRSVPIGKVSLFNEVTYVVQFTRDVPGIWWELDSGHHFDITSREMSRLTAVNPLMLRR